MRARVVGALTVLGLACVRLAAADPCRDPYGQVRSPITLGPGSSGFAAAVPACGETRLAVDGRGALTIAADAPDFYGLVQATSTLSGTYRVSERGFLMGGMDVVRWDYAVNATVTASQTTVGPPVLGGAIVAARSERTQLSMFMRTLFPLETGLQHGGRVGTESGLALLQVLTARIALHGTASLPVLWAYVGERGVGFVRPRLTVDGEFSLFSHWTVLAGLEIRAVNAPSRLDALVARGALRFPFGRHVELHLDAAVPFAGSARTDLQLGLGGAARF